MEYEFGYWYVLLALFILPGFYFLYRFYTKTKKSNSLKFSNLELVKKSASSQSQLRKHLPFILILVALSLIIIGLADPRIPLENHEKIKNDIKKLKVEMVNVSEQIPFDTALRQFFNQRMRR